MRIPASFCGLAALRPSVGNGGPERRYEFSGVFPISHTRDTIGPIARTMQDVALLDAVMSGTAQATARLRAGGAVLDEDDMPGLAELVAKSAFAIALHEAHLEMPLHLAAHGAAGSHISTAAANEHDEK